MELMQRGPCEREVPYLRFTIQRSGDLIYIPHLFAHAVSILDTMSSAILSGWDAATTSNQKVSSSNAEWVFFGVRRGKRRETFREKCLSALREWVFSPSTVLQESKDNRLKYWNNWEQHCPNLLSSLHIEKEVPRKIKSNRFPSYIHLNSLHA